MKIVCIVQARMGSTRLPGKVLKKLVDCSVLEQVITRIKHVSAINDIVIATTTDVQDDVIVEEAKRIGVHYYRGSEHDVLSRYYEAAKLVDADAIVRVTSDCPVIDVAIIDQLIHLFQTEPCHYLSNTLERSYPRGLDVEIFTFDSLATAYRLAEKPEQREHVTPYIYQNPDRFSLVSNTHPIDYSHLRWTLDTLEDWELIERIYEQLYKPGQIFSWHEILALMERQPELTLLNAHVEQKKLEG